ncbi:MAG: thioredoxin domain-containing protein [Gemmataceae bacterium]
MTAVPRNRLAAETSLYLRQHAGNPVDWFPWGPEALARAKELGRPIFLSVGYSACHWCHVMEHESFEDEATAGILNDHFVSIKVDREERPDLDQIYMTAHQLLTREGGGWPLSVFLTPDLTPFYAGTYFPPDDRYAPHRPSFPKLLHAIADAWATKRDQLEGLGRQVAEHLGALGEREASDGELSPDLLQGALKAMGRTFDRRNGGFGHAPKFPHAVELRLLFRLAARFGDREGEAPAEPGSLPQSASLSPAGAAGTSGSQPGGERGSAGVSPSRAVAQCEAAGMATLALEKMGRGGIYDQIGGGFARYSVDAHWLVPHFEKMLYDNALLPPAYVDGFLVTGDPFFRQITCETLDFVLREMTSPEGGFYSTLDADSEGEEGKFYVWSEAEIDRVLGEGLADFAKSVYGVTAGGNFEGHNILFRSKSDEQDAKLQRMSVEEFRAKLVEVKAKLYAERAKRVWPGRDEKHLTAWNGLMIAAFAHAGAALGEPKYTDAAVKAADFVLTRLRGANGRLFRTCGANQPAKLAGYLEDYAYLCDALVTLYEATFDPRWVRVANELADAMLKHFADPAGGFYYTADDHERLLARTKDMQDGSIPSGNAMATTALVRLAALTGKAEYRHHAERTLRAHHETMADHPQAAGQMLVALDLFLGPLDEVAVIGTKGESETERVLAAIRGKYRPNRVVAFHDPASGPPPAEVPLLADKPMRDAVTVYVCRDFACREPLVGAAAVEAG